MVHPVKYKSIMRNSLSLLSPKVLKASGRPNVEFWHSAEAEPFGKKPKHSAEYSAEYFYINKSSFWASDKEFFKA